jgi:hypothetical protein
LWGSASPVEEIDLRESHSRSLPTGTAPSDGRELPLVLDHLAVRTAVAVHHGVAERLGGCDDGLDAHHLGRFGRKQLDAAPGDAGQRPALLRDQHRLRVAVLALHLDGEVAGRGQLERLVAGLEQPDASRTALDEHAVGALDQGRRRRQGQEARPHAALRDQLEALPEQRTVVLLDDDVPEPGARGAELVGAEADHGDVRDLLLHHAATHHQAVEQPARLAIEAVHLAHDPVAERHLDALTRHGGDQHPPRVAVGVAHSGRVGVGVLLEEALLHGQRELLVPVLLRDAALHHRRILPDGIGDLRHVLDHARDGGGLHDRRLRHGGGNEDGQVPLLHGRGLGLLHRHDVGRTPAPLRLEVARTQKDRHDHGQHQQRLPPVQLLPGRHRHPRVRDGRQAGRVGQLAAIGREADVLPGMHDVVVAPAAVGTQTVFAGVGQSLGNHSRDHPVLGHLQDVLVRDGRPTHADHGASDALLGVEAEGGGRIVLRDQGRSRRDREGQGEDRTVHGSSPDEGEVGRILYTARNYNCQSAVSFRFLSISKNKVLLFKFLICQTCLWLDMMVYYSIKSKICQ